MCDWLQQNEMVKKQFERRITRFQMENERDVFEMLRCEKKMENENWRKAAKPQYMYTCSKQMKGE